MPKEMINRPPVFDPTSVDKNTPPVHGMAWHEPTVHVSWAQGTDFGAGQLPGRVQVALGLPVEYVKFLMDGEDVAPSVDAFSPELSRADVNKLIRTLRRARDQAFGRDE